MAGGDNFSLHFLALSLSYPIIFSVQWLSGPVDVQDQEKMGGDLATKLVLIYCKEGDDVRKPSHKKLSRITAVLQFLAIFLCGFAVFDEISSGFAVCGTPLTPPP